MDFCFDFIGNSSCVPLAGLSRNFDFGTALERFLFGRKSYHVQSVRLELLQSNAPATAENLSSIFSALDPDQDTKALK